MRKTACPVVWEGVGAQSPALDPIIDQGGELVLSNGDNLQDCFVDLSTGRILSAPPDIMEGLKAEGQLHRGQPIQVLSIVQWMRENNLDLVKRSGLPGVTLVDGMGVLAGKEVGGLGHFDRQTFEELDELQKLFSETLLLHTNRQPLGLAHYNFEPHGDEDTWIFQARNGRIGVIEIIDDGEGNQPVRLRYKWLETAPSSGSTDVPEKNLGFPASGSGATGTGQEMPEP